MPKKYRKLPVEIEAMQWTGTNFEEINNWCPSIHAGIFDLELYVAANNRWLPIEKAEWIIKDSLGFYTCKNEVFEQTYEEVSGS